MQNPSFPSVVRGIIINPEEKILMVRHRKSDPWVFPGWHVEANESLHDAMLREVSEELRITCTFQEGQYEEPLPWEEGLVMIPLPITGYQLSYTRGEKDRSRTEYIFVLETEDRVWETQQEEILEHAWFDPEDIAGGKVETFPMNQRIVEKLFYGEE